MRVITDQELASVVGGNDMQQVFVTGEKLPKDGVPSTFKWTSSPNSGGGGGRGGGIGAPSGTSRSTPSVIETTKVTETVCTTPTLNSVEMSFSPVTRGISVSAKGSTGNCTTTTRKTVITR